MNLGQSTAGKQTKIEAGGTLDIGADKGLSDFDVRQRFVASFLWDIPGPSTGIAKWMSKNGQGMHHVCVQVDDIDASLARLASHNVELINPQPVTKPNGTRYAFVHPRSTFGVLVELYEKA